MTAENNGTGAAPEGGEEDPFAYLYRQEGDGQQSAAPVQQPGVPRRSFNQVRAVGERQYGYGYPQQQQRSGYGYPQQQSGYGYPQQQSGYGYPQQPAPPESQPSAHYAAPETMPGGRAAARQQGVPGGNGRGGRNRTGLLVGAIAVVAAVVLGIGAAIFFNDDSSAEEPQAGDTGGNSQQDDQGQGGNDNSGNGGNKHKRPAPKALPKEDAAGLNLAGATVAKQVPGAQSRGGAYVDMNQPGAAATWEMKNLPAGGKYTLHVRYGVPGKDTEANLTVNGNPESRPLRLKNFSHAKEGDWENGWTNSWSNIQLHKGQNSIRIACDSGCEANLDKVWLTRGWS
ncbi:hypothetical protein ITI46_22215 [Streptomyces oryzae]|uniref:CBM6 domain-containing protein n=1 Tax=Streptomyces oryzae TaxID=1434886 RepID=A0ABS3XGB7_9ACTN|nr:hypothetical protein [Streptomyces oryzae]MBO8194356.1 hypothetical protein [Streptomyces oryzae]